MMMAPLASTGPVSGPGPLVLLVEDYPDTRELFADFLGEHGFRTAVAVDGRQAVELAQTLSPDLIVMDLSLPVLDGRQAISAIRADQRTSAIPVVALTGSSRAGNEAGGWDSLVTKPCVPEDLLQALLDLLARSSARGH